MLNKKLNLLLLLSVIVGNSLDGRNNRKKVMKCSQNSCQIPAPITKSCSKNSCAAPEECSTIALPDDFAKCEKERILAHYNGMVTKAKEQIDMESNARIHENTCKMKEIANAELICKEQQLRKLEQEARERACCELAMYAEKVKNQECRALKAEAEKLSSAIERDIKQSIHCAPSLDCNPCK